MPKILVAELKHAKIGFKNWRCNLQINIAICIYNNNSPADIIDDFEDNDSIDNTLLNKLKSDTINNEEIEELKQEIITSSECGATLRVEITKTPIDANKLTKKSTYYRLGWDHPNAFRAYGDGIRMDWTQYSYGWALYKYGLYYILISGFTA